MRFTGDGRHQRIKCRVRRTTSRRILGPQTRTKCRPTKTQSVPSEELEASAGRVCAICESSLARGVMRDLASRRASAPGIIRVPFCPGADALRLAKNISFVTSRSTAETVRFERTRELPPFRFSRPVPSTTQSRLRSKHRHRIQSRGGGIRTPIASGSCVTGRSRSRRTPRIRALLPRRFR